MQNVSLTKERILSEIQQSGPCFPVQIARKINVSPLFTSVFLSELYEDNKLRKSYMKVGSSSLYYINGQEQMLENSIEHLNQREKEAFFLIKSSQVLEDEKQSPVMRVALRAIKDFAVPFKITANGAEKIIWKYHLLSDGDFDSRVQKILNPNMKIKEEKVIPTIEEKKVLVKEEEAEESEKIEEIAPKVMEIASPSVAKKKSQAPSEFAEKIKSHLTSKGIEIVLSIIEKKKEFVAKIRADTLFGKQDYYLIAKDKKKINENDLALAVQKAQAEKMPSLIISQGEIDKKALNYASEWRNLIKFEKV